jgi:hypothetical protein|tara:strand:- start:37206 stop:37337 length:132 start_codon:yes stop_codon:yes gene_type:complete
MFALDGWTSVTVVVLILKLDRIERPQTMKERRKTDEAKEVRDD